MTALSCTCLNDGPYRRETVRYLGMDKTEGRYADVTVFRCSACGRLWLHYHVEYEHMRASGRWAMGLIDEAKVATIKPEEAADYLGGLEWYIYGGSWHGHSGKRGSTRLYWG